MMMINIFGNVWKINAETSLIHQGININSIWMKCVLHELHDEMI